MVFEVYFIYGIRMTQNIYIFYKIIGDIDR